MSGGTVSEQVRDRVLVMTIDNAPVNASSQGVRAGLLAGIRRLGDDPGLAGGVITGARGSFVAGSDISEFSGPVPEPLLPEVIAAAESCPRPVVAAIDGVALGGGLELALGCDVRIATATAQIGLPEVTLGMVPGAGGTQRLPRLTGRARAIDIVVTGRRVGAQEALRLGIIDEITASDSDLLARACAMAARAVKRPVAALPVPAEDPAAVERAAATAARGGRARPNALKAIELIRAAGSTPVGEALAAERAAFDHLRTAPEAAALRHLFFAERSAPRRGGAPPAPAPVSRAGVIGAGAMGAGIATAMALHGIAVRLVDADASQAGKAVASVREQIARGARRAGLDQAAADRAAESVTASADVADLAAADLIVEAVFEDLAVKTTVLRAAQETAPNAVLATNTSYLGVDRIAAALKDPGRLIGLHFFNPAHVMKLVEVVRGPHTADPALAAGLRLARDIGKRAVLAGDGEGFIGNRVFAAYRRHAEYLLEDGAFPDQVDAALESFGFGMGPFAVADLSGLQIARALRRRWRENGTLPARYVDIPDRLCDLGRLGRRAQAGYYTYDADGNRVTDPQVTQLISVESARKNISRESLSPAEIVDRTVGAMVIEGARAVADGTAAHIDDVDVAMVNGFGFPRHLGGPMWWARRQTAQRLAERVAATAEAAREPDPTPLVREVLNHA